MQNLVCSLQRRSQELIAGVSSGCARGRLGLAGKRKPERNGAAARSYGRAIGKDDAVEGGIRKHTMEVYPDQDKHHVCAIFPVNEGTRTAPCDDNEWVLQWQDGRNCQILNVEANEIASAKIRIFLCTFGRG
jgi:hypothetical protein